MPVIRKDGTYSYFEIQIRKDSDAQWMAADWYDGQALKPVWVDNNPPKDAMLKHAVWAVVGVKGYFHRVDANAALERCTALATDAQEFRVAKITITQKTKGLSR